MNAPKISVLMPVYNAERYLHEAVVSVLAQTFTDFELIAVDDGSSDGSLAILRDFERRDPRVRVISRPNTGIVGALNDGLAECRGEFIARMDADDVCLPERLAVQVEYLRTHLELLAIGSSFIWVDPDGVTMNERKALSDHAAIDQALMGGDGMAILHPTLMARRSALVAVGGYRGLAYHEDLDLYLRLADQGRLGNVDKVLLKYRAHTGSIVSTRRSHHHEVLDGVMRDALTRRGSDPVEWVRREGLDPVLRLEQMVWGSLSAGNFRGARRVALAYVRRRPLSLAAWRALACSLRGY